MSSPFKPVKHSLVAVVAKSDGVKNEVRVDSNRSFSLVKQVLKPWLISRWKPSIDEKKNEYAFRMDSIVDLLQQNPIADKN